MFHESHIDEYDFTWTYHPAYASAALSTGKGNTELISDLNGQPYQYFCLPRFIREYSPFGELLDQDNALSGNYNSYFRFNGKEFDPETGNYYYGARYMNPRTSVWLSVDPKAHAFPSVSPYSLIMNNPVMMIDPGGDSTVYFVNHNMSEADANTVMNHTRDINEKNGITGLDYKVISPDDAKDLKMIETDAVISLRGDMSEMGDEGNTSPYVFRESQDYETIEDTYVNLNSVDRNTNRADDKASRLYGYAYVAAHEIEHQYIAKASNHFWGNYNELGAHDNRTMNLNHSGGTHIPQYASPYLRPAEKMTPMHQNMIYHFLKQNGVRIR